MKTALIAIMLLTWLLSSANGAEKNIYYILDASESMWAQLQGSTKIEVANSIIFDRLPSWKIT